MSKRVELSITMNQANQLQAALYLLRTHFEDEEDMKRASQTGRLTQIVKEAQLKAAAK